MPLFRRKPSIPATGHPGVDRLLEEIAKRSSLDAPRHWVHYLYFADEHGARSAAEVIGSAGWQLQRVEKAATGDDWVVIAEQHDVVTSAEAVTEARLFFEGVASTTPGGDYDGWEASL
jgi:hypothetical protein